MRSLLMLPTFWSRLDAARQAVQLARQCARTTFDVLWVVDEVPPSESCQGLLEAPGDLLSCAPTRRGAALAFTHGVQAFLASEADCLMILEDGIQVVPAWDAWLSQVLRSHPEMGWVACLQMTNPGTTFTSMASMMSRAAAQALASNPGGAFDAQFNPYHYEDSDAIMRLRGAGFLPHGIPIRVNHPQSQTGARDPGAHYVLGLAHRRKFGKRWDCSDFDWWSVPIHRQCPRCGVH